MLEAMSIASPIIASDTEPVKEIITDNQNGILVDFFDHHDLARKIDRLFNDAALRDKIGLGARIHAVNHYDLDKICLPAQLDWINSIAS
jgi:glycosyltransferase involved in cell wall biosynthesis